MCVDKSYFKKLGFFKDDFYVIIWLISWVFLGIYEYELFDFDMFEIRELLLVVRYVFNFCIIFNLYINYEGFGGVG